jgi:hypothetical protein
MANELTVSASVRFSKGGTEISKAYGGLQVTVSGTRAIVNRQTVGITEEAVVVGDVGTCGYLLAKNLDATNFVSLRPGTGTANAIKLKAGEVCLFRVSTAPWAIADTAPVDVEFTIIPD